MAVVTTLEELRGLAGREIAVTEWFEITQERIDKFADATEDHQWIHVDVERATRECRTSPTTCGSWPAGIRRCGPG